MTGVLSLHDKENLRSDEHRTIDVDESFSFSPQQTEYMYEVKPCVGKEVRLELQIRLTLQFPDGSVLIVGTAKYFEGTSCNTNDLERDQSFNFIVRPGENVPLNFQLADGDGSVKVDLMFTNT
jgi:hypothetical protein